MDITKHTDIHIQDIYRCSILDSKVNFARIPVYHKLWGEN